MLHSSRICLLCLAALILMASASSVMAGDLSPSPGSSSLSLNGTAFQDMDADGFLSENEPGLPGRTIRLMQDGSEILSATTDEQGCYLFSDLSAGIYELREDPVQGWNQTSPGGDFYQVRLTDKPGFGLDFGELQRSDVAAELPVFEYPIMQPTPEEASLWLEQYNTSPRAYLSPALAATLAEAPGASYSLMDYLQYTPAERNQGSCGNCWAWAGTGVMEIDYARQNAVKDRFSVQYLDSNLNGGCGLSGACCGGWLSNLASFYSVKGMAVPWSNANAQYRDGSRSCGRCTAVSASAISTNPHYSLTSIAPRTVSTIGVGKETAISNIKNVLAQGKAIWFGFFLPNSSAWSNFRSFWSSMSESAVWQPDFACNSQYDYANGGGHAVLCVGYDDSDPNNRYWIMLNSWGSNSLRPAGLFRVNMDMNYDCAYGSFGYAFYWMTLDISYPEDDNRAPATPEQPSGQSTGYLNQELSYSTSTSDADGDEVNYIFDWGDGRASQTGLAPSLARVSASHAWQRSGTYNVRAVAQDSHGAQSSWSSSLAVVISKSTSRAPKKPSAPVGVKRGYAGRAYSYSSYSSDPNRDRIFYTFNWGDGTASQTGFVNSGKKGRASHIWSSAGAYPVKVMATDSTGASSPWSGAITIRIASASGSQERSRIHAERQRASRTKRSVLAL